MKSRALQNPSAGPSALGKDLAEPLVILVDSNDLRIVDPEPAQPTNERRLVELESENDSTPAPLSGAKGKGRAEDLIAKLPATAPISALEPEPAVQPRVSPVDLDAMAVDQVLSSPGHTDSQQTQSSNGHDPRLVGAETQALLEEFAQARQAAKHDSPATHHNRSPHIHHAATRIEEQHVRSTSALDAQSPGSRIRSPQIHTPARPAHDLIRTRHSLPASTINLPPRHSGTTRMSIPLRLEFDFRGVTVGEGRGRERYETPSPMRNRSLLRDEIITNASKRRRALEKSAPNGKRERNSPDKVYVSTSIPAPQSTPSTSPQPNSNPVSNEIRSNLPALTPAERTDRILAGQQLILAVRDQYKARISSLSGKYKVKPTELYKVVNEMPRSGGRLAAQVYWADVEEGLRRHFGY